MKDTVVFRPPDAGDDSGGSSPALPLDLVRLSASRLGWAALVYAVTYFLAYGSGMVGQALTNPALLRREYVSTVVALVSIGFAIHVFRFTRSHADQPGKLLRLGLTFEVLGSLGISMTSYGWIYRVGPLPEMAVGISWVCVWIVVFPLLVVAKPRQMLIAAFLSASTGPLVVIVGYLVNGRHTDHEYGLGATLYFLFFSSYICVGMAYFASHVIHRFGKDVTEARRLGSYKLVERLGAGGMGEVWRADHNLLARPAAIKLIRPEVLGGTDRERQTLIRRRFEQEAQATALLTSPHVVALYDFGVTHEGAFYTVMELLDGLDLQNLVDRFGPVPPERAVHLLTQACDALAEAHEHGLIHRDVKPANLFAARVGSACDFIKVLDFGLVKFGSGRDATDINLTREGTTTGTPATIAPEVASGVREVDGRADIYGLGCVAFWLLTGKQVFQAESAMEMVAHHLNTPPTAPSEFTELHLPPALDRIVLDCLAKQPDQRPSTATELADRLREAVPATWTPIEARTWWDNHMS